MGKDMRLTQNARALSRFSLVLLLLGALIIGALLSYLWVIGYYESLDIRVPEVATVTITNATFLPQNTTFFNVTLLNPSFSPSDASIREIAVSTKDGILHSIQEAYPPLPYRLVRSGSETFRCSWNWANYTGETMQIIVFLDDGSGATFPAVTPLVNLTIKVGLNSTISIARFNMTIQNSASSVTHVNITEITLDTETVPLENITISLPYPLHPDESVSFTCMWNWANYQGRSVAIAAHTLQGYTAYHTQAVPPPVNLTITQIIFNTTDTSHFNATVQNSELSPTYVDITRITITLENGTTREIAEVKPSLTPYTLHPNTTVTFMCTWNWADYRNKNITLTVHTLQGYVVSRTQATPAFTAASSLKSLSKVPRNITLPANREAQQELKRKRAERCI